MVGPVDVEGYEHVAVAERSPVVIEVSKPRNIEVTSEAREQRLRSITHVEFGKRRREAADGPPRARIARRWGAPCDVVDDEIRETLQPSPRYHRRTGNPGSRSGSQAPRFDIEWICNLVVDLREPNDKIATVPVHTHNVVLISTLKDGCSSHTDTQRPHDGCSERQYLHTPKVASAGSPPIRDASIIVLPKLANNSPRSATRLHAPNTTA